MLDFLDIGATRVHDVAFTDRSAIRVTGLSGATGARGELYARPEADGGVPPRASWLEPRTWSFEAELWATSISSVWTAWDAVTQALEDAMRGEVVIGWRKAGGNAGVDERQGKGQIVSLAPPVLDANQNGPVISYQAQIRMSDPRWYSQTLQQTSVGAPTASGGLPLPLVLPLPFGSGVTGGNAIVLDSGKSETWPLITIAGPISGPVVAALVQNVAIYLDTLVLNAGDTLVIDTNPATRSVTVAGSNVAGAIRWADSTFFSLLPGIAETLQFYGQGGGYAAGTTMTVAWRDAYMS